ncbi:hypothetical protein ACFXTH_035592 [Malus domestica]
MSKLPEDLETTLLQILQRLENASTGFKRKIDLVVKPNIPISLPLVREEDYGEEEREKLEASQPDEEMSLANNPPSPYQGQVETMLNKHAYPFLEALVNMINLAWAEKGK